MADKETGSNQLDAAELWSLARERAVLRAAMAMRPVQYGADGQIATTPRDHEWATWEHWKRDSGARALHKGGKTA